jgi:hypothetical protein
MGGVIIKIFLIRPSNIRELYLSFPCLSSEILKKFSKFLPAPDKGAVALACGGAAGAGMDAGRSDSAQGIEAEIPEAQTEGSRSAPKGRPC